MLYLIKLEMLKNTYYKVGYTKDQESLKKRMYTYYTATPECKLLYSMEGTMLDEKYYHQKMLENGKRYMTTEWYYKLSEEYIIKLIEEFKNKGKNVSFKKMIKESKGLRPSVRKVPIGLVSYSVIHSKYIENVINGVKVEWDIRQLEHENYKIIDEYYKATGKFTLGSGRCKKLLKLHYDFKQIKEEAIKTLKINIKYKYEDIMELLQNICDNLGIKKKILTCHIKNIFGEDNLKMYRYQTKEQMCIIFYNF